MYYLPWLLTVYQSDSDEDFLADDIDVEEDTNEGKFLKKMLFWHNSYEAFCINFVNILTIGIAHNRHALNEVSMACVALLLYNVHLTPCSDVSVYK